jgi:hypothetical protein
MRPIGRGLAIAVAIAGIVPSVAGSRSSFRWAIEMVPTIMAGETGGQLGDSPARRIDPNTASSPYRGVASLMLRFPAFPDGFFLCSSSAITRRHVLTAAHCVTDENGDLALAPSDVTVFLNIGGNLTHKLAVSAIAVNPGYQPMSTGEQHDVAVLTLAADLGPEVVSYDILRAPVPLHTVVTMVGYGLSGDGHTGIDYKGGSFLSVKRSGAQTIDFIGQPGSRAAGLFFYDFDAPDGSGLNVLGGLSLGNRIETSSAYGDSGGPSFVTASDGSLLVAGLNNVGILFRAYRAARSFQQRISTFGEGGGGVVVPQEAQWIDSITGGRPAPASPAFDIDGSDTSTALITDLTEDSYDVFLLSRSARRPLRIQ